MRESGRWHLTDLQLFFVVLTVVAGLFLGAMALGSGSLALVLAAATLVVGTGLGVFLLGLRHNGRVAVQGTGYVISVPRPPAGSVQGRCDMRMRVNLPGRPAVDIKVRASAVPVTRWPVPGQTLPIEVPPSNPRQVRVRWDLVELGYIRAPDVTPPRQYTPTSLRGDPTALRSNPTPLHSPPSHSPTPIHSPTPLHSPTPTHSPTPVRIHTEYAESTLGGPSAPTTTQRPTIVAQPSSPDLYTDPYSDYDEYGEPVVGRPPAGRAAPPPSAPSEVPPPANQPPANQPPANLPPAQPSRALADDPFPELAEPLPELPTLPDLLRAPDPAAVRDLLGTPTPAFEDPPDFEDPPADPTTSDVMAAPEPPSRVELSAEGSIDDDSVDLGDALPGLLDPGLDTLPSETALRNIPSPRPAEAPPIRLSSNDRVEGEAPAMGGMLIVSDLDRSLRFYSEILEFTIVYAASGNAVVEYGGGRILLQHMADFSPIDRRVGHLHIEVPDLDLAFTDLAAKGVQFSHRPKMVSRGDHMELWKATFRDPDGHGIALTEWRPRERD